MRDWKFQKHTAENAFAVSLKKWIHFIDFIIAGRMHKQLTVLNNAIFKCDDEL
jgi:hypothetical protein